MREREEEIGELGERKREGEKGREIGRERGRGRREREDEIGEHGERREEAGERERKR